jgi:hypothetical protein
VTLSDTLSEKGTENESVVSMSTSAIDAKEEIRRRKRWERLFNS